MTISLPTIISEYLSAFERNDLEAVLACFGDGAVVFDEGEEMRGHDGIREWLEKVTTAYQWTVTVRGATELGMVDGLERHDVYTHLKGNFPGGEVDLTDRFGLRDGRISRLEIVPTQVEDREFYQRSQ